MILALQVYGVCALAFFTLLSLTIAVFYDEVMVALQQRGSIVAQSKHPGLLMLVGVILCSVVWPWSIYQAVCK